jgi:hypothetical protein
MHTAPAFIASTTPTAAAVAACIASQMVTAAAVAAAFSCASQGAAQNRLLLPLLTAMA